ncbi:MAG: hypothetical protein J6I49_04455 [Bacteroidales bacterium]|nr:hypothetical protein [Bacteroidales bacterium]
MRDATKWLLPLLFITPLHAQVKTSVDTLHCHIVGFAVGAQMPLGGKHSGGMAQGGMKDLYKGPYLDFDVEWAYKFRSNWMLTLDADIWFGYNNDNLQLRAERIGDVYNSQGHALSLEGTDGVVTAYNRSLAVRPGVAKIITLFPNDPNSGLLLKLSGGWFMQKSIFSQDMNESKVPQLTGDYSHLYDHYRNGFMLTESVGFAYMSNYRTYINVKITFDFSQCVSWSSRPYTIDNVMGLNGKDGNRYLDLMFGVKLSWLFPITGRTSYDYYYY